MKILIIDSANITFHYTVPFCNAFIKKGIPIKLLCSQNQKKSDYIYEIYSFFNIDNILFFKKIFRGVNYFIGSIRVISYVKKNSIDVVHFQISPLPIIDIFVAMILKKYALVGATIHNTTPFHGTSGSFIQRIGFKKLISKYDFLICHTKYSSKVLQNDYQIDNKKISIIEHPLFKKVKNPRDTDVKKSISTNKILFFGTISEYKGIDILIKALGELPNSLKEKTTLTIAGKSLMKNIILKKQAIELGVDQYIHWKEGWIEDKEVEDLFLTNDIIVMPYRHIDGSGVLVQALENNLPVIASDIGGFQDLIEHEKTGLLFKANDHIHLSKCISKIFDNPNSLKNISKSMHSKALSMPTWDNLVEISMNSYKNAKNRQTIN